jgi:glutamate-1-semialdehyde aminotransferase
MERRRSEEASERVKLFFARVVGSAIRSREFPFDVPLFVQSGKGSRLWKLLST